MRICDGCGKEIPIGANSFIELRVFGQNNTVKIGCTRADFHSVECLVSWTEKRLENIADYGSSTQ